MTWKAAWEDLPALDLDERDEVAAERLEPCWRHTRLQRQSSLRRGTRSSGACRTERLLVVELQEAREHAHPRGLRVVAPYVGKHVDAGLLRQRRVACAVPCGLFAGADPDFREGG
jgi:hypothetical protein